MGQFVLKIPKNIRFFSARPHLGIFQKIEKSRYIRKRRYNVILIKYTSFSTNFNLERALSEEILWKKIYWENMDPKYYQHLGK